MRAPAASVICLVSALSITGCFNPEFGEGGFRCATNKQCPDNYECIATPHPTEPGATIFECRPDGAIAPASISATVTPTKVRRGASVSVVLDAKNFVIDPSAVDTAKVDGSGHVHAFLESSVAGKGRYVDRLTRVKTQLTIPPDVAPGAHLLVFALAHNDHDLVTPAVEFTVDIKVLP